MRLIVLPLLALAVALPAHDAPAQTPGTGAPAGPRSCSWRVDPGGVTAAEGSRVNILDPFTVTCNDGANIRANSGMIDRVTRVVTLTGDVDFDDPTRSLTADRAVYDSGLGMLHATGDVVFTDRVEGTTLTGPELEYYRATDQRSEALVNAFGRPRLTLTRRPGAEDEGEADAEAEDGAPIGDAAIIGRPAQEQRPSPAPGAAATDTSDTPLVIDADRMTIEGRSDLTAIGNVVIQDDQMRAVADEAEQRGSSETLELRGSAAIHSREYSLQAQTIFATVPEGSIREVEARGNARLLGEDLDVDAPQLDLLFEENLLQRTIARSVEALAPGVQPIATSPTFRLQADSIDASLPGQRLESVVAIGNARGETIDTTRVESAPTDTLLAPTDSLGAVAVEGQGEDQAGVAAMFESGDSVTTVTAARLVENDWITGDTITGYFMSVIASPADTLASEEGATPEDDPSADVAALEPLEPPSEGADTTLVMERLVAVGAARSLYHVAPEAGSPPGTRPGINFLSAAHIELRFADGQVQVADVTGLRRGLYLEPIAAVTDDPEGIEGDDAEAEDDADAAEPAAPIEPANDEVIPSDPDATSNPGVDGE